MFEKHAHVIDLRVSRVSPVRHPRKHRGLHFPVASASDRAGFPQAYHVVRLNIAASAEETLSVEPRDGRGQLVFGAAVSLFLGQRSACFLGWVSSFLGRGQ
eukprot:scaffold73122_cov61-Phaeocystis_antarctica.AAC.1